MDEQKKAAFKQAALEQGIPFEEVDDFLSALDTVPSSESVTNSSFVSSTPQPAYDPTGKTFEQIMAETGRQHEFDTLTQGGTQPSYQDPDISNTPPFPPQETILPIPAKVTQPYGNVNPSLETFSGGKNLGADFSTPKGSPLAAPPGEWRVLDVFSDAQEGDRGANQGSGNMVTLINTQTGETLGFEHLSKPLVTQGQSVVPGDVIGLSGNTGNSTGAHSSIAYRNSAGEYKDVLQSPYASFVEPEAPPEVPLPTVAPTNEVKVSSPPEPPSPESLVSPVPSPQVTEPTLVTQNDLFSPNVSATPNRSVMPNMSIGTQPSIPSISPVSSASPELLDAVPSSQREAAATAVPAITTALKEQGITDPAVIAYALATASHESGFVPKEEIMAQRGKNARNDYIASLQDNYQGGSKYHGRGYIQLTHKDNYEKYGKQIGEDLVNHPEKANDPEIAAKILAVYIKDAGVADAVQSGNYDEARVKVQGKGALSKPFIATTSSIANDAKKWQKYLGT